MADRIEYRVWDSDDGKPTDTLLGATIMASGPERAAELYMYRHFCEGEFGGFPGHDGLTLTVHVAEVDSGNVTQYSVETEFDPVYNLQREEVADG